MNATKNCLKLFLTGCALLLPGIFLTAAPMVSIGNNTDLFFNGRASLELNDNITLDPSNELDDVVFHFVPGIEINFGRGQTNADFTILWQEDFVRYTEEDQFDSQQTSVIASGSYETPKFSGSLNLAYLERQSNTNNVNFIGNLIDQDVVTGSAQGEWVLTPKTSFGAGVNYDDIAYQGFAETIIPDRQTLSIPINFYYAISPKLDLSAGYQYRDVDIEDQNSIIGNDPEDHFLNVGLRGEFNPKLTGNIRVGFQERSFSVAGQDDESSLAVDGELVWEASPKVQVTTRLFSDFGIGGAGGSIEQRGIDLNLDYGLSQLWFMGANLGFENSDYVNSTREDDLIDFGVNVRYVPNEYVTFSAGYSYADNDSSLAIADYSQNVLKLTASLRY